MKKILAITVMLVVVVLIATACSIAKKDTQINDKLDLSKESFKIKINDAFMTKDFGLYGEVENEVGFVIHGNVENGKIHENSKINFVDENGKLLYNDKVFKIEIEKSTSSSYSSKQQSYAESGDDVALYLKAGKADPSEDSKSAKILNLIKTSYLIESE